MLWAIVLWSSGAAKYRASQRLLVASSLMLMMDMGVVASLYSLEALSLLALPEREFSQELSFNSCSNLRCSVSILKHVDRRDLSWVLKEDQ